MGLDGAFYSKQKKFFFFEKPRPDFVLVVSFTAMAFGLTIQKLALEIFIQYLLDISCGQTFS
jgi:hypothetical protein